MHFLGLAGMPRRIVEYPSAFTQWNLVASVGSIISTVATLFFFLVVLEAFLFKKSPKVINLSLSGVYPATSY